MNTAGLKNVWFTLVVVLLSVVFESVSLLRYAERLPGDRVGIALHVAVIIGLVVLASFLVISARRREGSE
jgi:hypothetical protein